MAFLTYAAMKKLNYYDNPLEKHLAWLGFHSSIGISLASAVHVFTRSLSPTRHLLADVFCLTGYNFGY